MFIIADRNQPICILLNEQLKPQMDNITQFTAVGWGSTGYKKGSDELQMRQIHRKEQDTCFNNFWIELLDSQICAGTSGDSDSIGDSGGPLYTHWLYGPIYRATQLGIKSGGEKNCWGTGIYTDVMGHIDMIERIVLDNADIEVVLPTFESIRPICLPSPSNEAAQKKFQRWAADPSQKIITVGRGIRTHVAVRLWQNYQEIGERQLCVERPAHHILRLGSGSPLVSHLPHGNREAFSLVGLASFGRRQDFAPDVYTNALGYLKWIGDSVTLKTIL
ncbi:LOW QUALITY PROTEIN: uncharacterized protein Dere_GG26424 [Drosophila erecta]|uniref:Peptidase S1 domain-containing protein n=1 Tax=Drosophila erecta TaxID=7220 RepID=A0A0Q5VMH0_DROER|nr:LOW QUALITY PROTEIN: uncharacterized protein Dere_GG26424 [Drosophila erecta]